MYFMVAFYVRVIFVKWFYCIIYNSFVISYNKRFIVFTLYRFLNYSYLRHKKNDKSYGFIISFLEENSSNTTNTIAM